MTARDEHFSMQMVVHFYVQINTHEYQVILPPDVHGSL